MNLFKPCLVYFIGLLYCCKSPSLLIRVEALSAQNKTGQKIKEQSIIHLSCYGPAEYFPSTYVTFNTKSKVLEWVTINS